MQRRLPYTDHISIWSPVFWLLRKENLLHHQGNERNRLMIKTYGTINVLGIVVTNVIIIIHYPFNSQKGCCPKACFTNCKMILFIIFIFIIIILLIFICF